MKKIIISIFLFTISSLHSQTYIKGNLLTSLVLVPNVGIETSIGEKSTFHFDFTGSFWKSINGKPTQFYIFIPEYRYHFKKKYGGLYIGGHIGGTIFNFQKWSNLDTNLYEKGLGYLIGATLGYQKKINKKFNIDFFLGGGNHQGFYKGYHIGSKERYDSAKDFNKSGEWLPYRGGIMVSYRLN